MNRIMIYGYALLAFSLLLASAMPIAFMLGNILSPFTLLFYVTIVGTLTSFALMVGKGTTSNLKALLHDRHYFNAILTITLLAYVIEPFAFSYGTHYVNADLAAVAFRTWPIMLILLAPLVIRERVTRWDLVGVTVGFLGLAVTLVGGTILSLPITLLPFVGIILVAAFADALSSAVSKRYNYELVSSIFAYNFIALLVFTPIALYTGAWRLPAFNINVIFPIVFLGAAFFAMFGYVFYESLRIVKTSIASTSYIGSSFITMALAALFLGEPVEPAYIVIALSVTAGVLIQKLAPKAKFGNFIASKSEKGANYPEPIYDVTSAFINTANTEVSSTMKGGGRVLAFYTDWKGNKEDINPYLFDINGEGCVLFTDRHEIASKEELDFIREVTGCTDKDLIVMGSGEPEKVMGRFARLNSLIAEIKQSYQIV